MGPCLERVRTKWIGRLIIVSVIAGVLLSALTVQLGVASQPAKSSPAHSATRAAASGVAARSSASSVTVPVVALREEVEPREPHRPKRPTPTAETIVFPAPILPPTPDDVRRVANVPILMYHYISSPPTVSDRIRVGLSVAPAVFEAQVKLLADNGFTAISLFDLYEHLATGKALPAKPIVLTFDDGYVDNFENAFPILKAHGMVGTFFVLTAPADNVDPAYLTWDMVKTMSEAGMDMQLHSKEHVDLRHRDYDYLVWEIIGGRQSIEAHTGKPVVLMAYPSGKYDAAVLKFLANNNFWAAVTTESGKTHTLADRLTWTRLRIAGQLSLNGFVKLLGIRP